MKKGIFFCLLCDLLFHRISEKSLYDSFMMLQHPGVLLLKYLKEIGYTQKDFSKKIGKKTSEINELIRGKRNITVARDIILTKNLSTEPKFWIIKQVDYDYEQAMLNEGNELNNSIIRNTSGIIKNDEIESSNSEKKTIQEIIEEERNQSKYLKENILQETPLYEENLQQEEKNENKDKDITKNIPIEELLKEDPIIEISPLSQVFDSF